VSSAGWDDVNVVGVVHVRVTVGDERGWFIEVRVIGQCVVVCCDRAVDVEVKGIKMASVGAVAGIVHGRGSGVDDGGHAFVTDVAVYLVVDVEVSA
jgi:hypothetical protein